MTRIRRQQLCRKWAPGLGGHTARARQRYPNTRLRVSDWRGGGCCPKGVPRSRVADGPTLGQSGQTQALRPRRGSDPLCTCCLFLSKKKKKASCGLPTSWSGNFYLKRLKNCTKFSSVSPLPEDGRSFIFRSIFAPLSSPLHRLLPATALDKDVNPQSAELTCALV